MPASRKPSSDALPAGKKTNPPTATDCFGILHLILAAKQRAYQAVYSELVILYWQVGEYIKLESAEWGEKAVDQLARYLAGTQPGLRGAPAPIFSECTNSMRLRNDTIVSALLTQVPWTHHLAIQKKCPAANLNANSGPYGSNAPSAIRQKS